MSKIVKKKDLDVLIENTMSKAGIIKEYDRALGTTINLARKVSPTGGLARVLSIIHDLLSLDYEAAKHSITNKEGFNKISYVFRELNLIGIILDEINKTACKGGSCLRGLDLTDLKKPSFNELVEYGFDVDKIIEYLNDPDVLEYLQNDIKLRVRMDELDEIIKFLEELKNQYDGVVRNESKLNIGKLINEGDYYGSFGNMGKWYDEQDREYEMEDGDWDEDEYATWDEYSNSPYGASASNRWSINPSAKSGGWDPEMAFNKYVDTHGPMRVRRRKMTQPDMMESKSNKKPLINENVQKELDRFNRLSNYTFKK